MQRYQVTYRQRNANYTAVVDARNEEHAASQILYRDARIVAVERIKPAKKTVSAYELIDHGIDGCQYFPGCGTYGTAYSHVVTGCGDNPAEAIEDALEQIACGEDSVDVDALEAQILADAGWREFPTSPSVTDNSDELYYYVSIRYNLGE